jgi:hypothetical protein
MARKHHSRKHHKRASRKTHRRHRNHRTRRNQQGGSSCAYMPLMNRQMAQIGGMASMDSAYGTLLDAPTAVQAQVGPLNAAFAELSHVIPKQQGGRRSRKHRSRRHRGGMHPFESAFGPVVQQPAGASAQFMTEGEVNKSFGNFGPQH